MVVIMDTAGLTAVLLGKAVNGVILKLRMRMIIKYVVLMTTVNVLLRTVGVTVLYSEISILNKRTIHLE